MFAIYTWGWGNVYVPHKEDSFLQLCVLVDYWLFYSRLCPEYGYRQPHIWNVDVQTTLPTIYGNTAGIFPHYSGLAANAKEASNDYRIDSGWGRIARQHG